MARKVLISFLGTAPYIKSSYYLGEQSENEPVVNYVQCAIFRDVCKDWSSEDLCLILTTDKAESENWHKCKNYDDEQGLENALKSYDYQAQVKNLNIETGLNVKEIYDIFNAVFEKLEPEDQIYFDVTNSFRYLPMLGLVLFNYAKVVRNIAIEKIYYGAFETLGNFRDVPQKYPNPKDRKVPIFDLTSLVTLQEWASISNEFINLGESKNFEKVSGKHSDLAEKLDDLVKSIRTSRGGKLIYNFDFQELKNKIQNAKLEQVPNQKQMERLLEKIEAKIDDFDQMGDIRNGFTAVKWCIDYDLIQQGYTLLQETIKTWLIHHTFGETHKFNREYRESANSALLGFESSHKGGRPCPRTQRMYYFLCENYAQSELKINYKKFTGEGLRNDVNHGGFKEDYAQPEKLTSELEELYHNFRQILTI